MVVAVYQSRFDTPRPTIAFPALFDLTTPPLVTYAQRAPDQAAMIPTGIYLPPEPIPRVNFGEDLFQILPTKQPFFQASAQFAGMFLPPEPIQQVNFGEDLFQIPLTKQPFFQASAQFAGIFLSPESIPIVNFGEDLFQIPPTKQPFFQASAQFAGSFIIPIVSPPRQQPGVENFSTAFTTYALRSKAPSAMFASGEFRSPQIITTTFSYGWSVNIHEYIVEPRHIAGTLAGADLPPEPIQQVNFGEDLFQIPPTKQPFFQASAQFSGSFLQTPQIITTFPYGWSDVIPDLPREPVRLQPFPEYSIRIDFIPIPPTTFGAWLLRPIDLPLEPRHVAAVLAGYDQAPGAIEPAGRPRSLGYELTTPPLVTYTPRINVGAAMVASGEMRSPQVIIQTLPNGWSIILHELPQFIRHQAMPEYTSRQDFLPLQKTVPYFIDLLRDLPQYSPKQVMPEIFLRLDLPGQERPYGGEDLSVIIPDLPRFIRLQAMPEYTSRQDFLPTVAVVPFGAWTVELHELPNFVRLQAMPEHTWRIDFLYPERPYGGDLMVDIPEIPHPRYYLQSTDPPPWLLRLVRAFVTGVHMVEDELSPIAPHWWPRR